MKLYKKLKNNWTLFLSVLVLCLPFAVLLLVWLVLKINVFDNSSFWYAYMAYFGTVLLAGVALFQTQKTSDLTKKFDEMNALQNYSLAMATDKCEFSITPQMDRTVSWPAHHKDDAGAVVLIPSADDDGTKPLNCFLLELYFQDYSKAALKSFDLVVDQMVLVQEPDENGLTWRDNSDHPIPAGFAASPAGTTAYPIWTSPNMFKIMLKIYAPNNGIVSNVLENPIPFCLMFRAILRSVCGPVTTVRYKYWFYKLPNGEPKVEKYETLIIDTSLGGITDAD